MKYLADESQLNGSRRQALNIQKLFKRAQFSTQQVAEVQDVVIHDEEHAKDRSGTKKNS